MSEKKQTKTLLDNERKIMEMYLGSLFKESLSTQQLQDLLPSTPPVVQPEIVIQKQVVDEKKLSPYPWAQSLFRVMRIQLGDHKVAIPLARLYKVFANRNQITYLPGYPPWYLGMFTHSKETIHVANGAWWLSNAEQRKNVTDTQHPFLIRIWNSPWAISCQEVLGMEDLDPREVNWRPTKRHLPWLAGTVGDGLFAIINPDVLAFMFACKIPTPPRKKTVQNQNQC